MSASLPIFLFTDFGSADIYVGQVKAVLHDEAPTSPVIDLLNDAPEFDIEASAHLIAALASRLPTRSVLVAVVDPGVGGMRDAIAMEADGHWYVGPDNGLLSVVAARARAVKVSPLTWMPAPKSVSFHGRDLFAPAAAHIAASAVDLQTLPTKKELDVQYAPGDLMKIIYVDHYGNLVSGVRAAELGNCTVRLGARSVARARSFFDVPPGALFWYENSIGLLEVAANQASASHLLNVGIGHGIGIDSA